MTAALEALRAALAAYPDLAERLRAESSAGYDEWRVQDPKDGAYCIAFSWPGTLHPELEARAWLADQQDRFPQGRYADYVVACVRVVPTKDRLLREAADALQAAPDLLAEVDRLKAERDALRAVSTGAAKLAAFGRWCAEEFRRELADVDGGSAQDAMERLGVLKRVEVVEPCGDGCVCAEVGFPADCYVFADDVKAALKEQA